MSKPVFNTRYTLILSYVFVGEINCSDFYSLNVIIQKGLHLFSAWTAITRTRAVLGIAPIYFCPAPCFYHFRLAPLNHLPTPFAVLFKLPLSLTTALIFLSDLLLIPFFMLRKNSKTVHTRVQYVRNKVKNYT